MWLWLLTCSMACLVNTGHVTLFSELYKREVTLLFYLWLYLHCTTHSTMSKGIALATCVVFIAWLVTFSKIVKFLPDDCFGLDPGPLSGAAAFHSTWFAPMFIATFLPYAHTHTHTDGRPFPVSSIVQLGDQQLYSLTVGWDPAPAPPDRPIQGYTVIVNDPDRSTPFEVRCNLYSSNTTPNTYI